MVEVIMDSGLMVSSMVKDNINLKIDLLKMVYGKMGKESNG